MALIASGFLWAQQAIIELHNRTFGDDLKVKPQPHSCNPCGESLLQLQADEQWPRRTRRAARIAGVGQP